MYKSEFHDATDEVEEFWPDDEGECAHFLPFLQDNDIDNTDE